MSVHFEVTGALAILAFFGCAFLFAAVFGSSFIGGVVAAASGAALGVGLLLVGAVVVLLLLGALAKFR